MYVILTSKHGVFRTEPGAQMAPVEAYEYFFCGKPRARFVIASLEAESRIVVTEEEPPHVVNRIPTKFLPHFSTIELARAELRELTAEGKGMDIRLEQVALEPAAGRKAAPGKLQVTFITNGNKVAEAAPDSNLLRVSLREQGGIPFKCGGGLCGTCRCRIEQGLENTDAVKPKERRHLTEQDFAAGWRMACQTFLKGDVSVSWDPKPRAAGALNLQARNQPAPGGA